MLETERIDADIASAKAALQSREAALATATEAISRLNAERALALADGEAGVRLRTQARELQTQAEDLLLALPILKKRLLDIQAERRKAAITDGDALLTELRAAEDAALAASDVETYLSARRFWIGVGHDLFQLTQNSQWLAMARAPLQGRLDDDAYRAARYAPRAPLPSALAARLEKWQRVFGELMAEDAGREAVGR